MSKLDDVKAFCKDFVSQKTQMGMPFIDDEVKEQAIFWADLDKDLKDRRFAKEYKATSEAIDKVDRIAKLHSHKAKRTNIVRTFDACAQCGDEWPCETYQICVGELNDS